MVHVELGRSEGDEVKEATSEKVVCGKKDTTPLIAILDFSGGENFCDIHDGENQIAHYQERKKSLTRLTLSTSAINCAESIRVFRL